MTYSIVPLYHKKKSEFRDQNGIISLNYENKNKILQFLGSRNSQFWRIPGNSVHAGLKIS